MSSLDNVNFDEVVLDYVFDNGCAVRKNHDSFSWKDEQVLNHQEVDNCSGFRSVGSDVRLVERYVYEFIDTFNGSNQKIGLEVRGDIECLCGSFRVSNVRLNGNFTDILFQIIRESGKIPDIEKEEYDD